jgi:hypothetical protein
MTLHGDLVLCDSMAGTEVWRSSTRHPDIIDVVVLPGGHHVIAASRDGTVRLGHVPQADEE